MLVEKIDQHSHFFEQLRFFIELDNVLLFCINFVLPDIVGPIFFYMHCIKK